MKGLKWAVFGFLFSLIYLTSYASAAASDKPQNTHPALLGFAQEPARVLHVPADYASISAALAASRSGDRVQVEAGTYQEYLTIPSGVALVGAGWENTTIQGQGKGVVVFAGANSQVEGFTIKGSGPGYYDSGIQVSQGKVSVLGVRLNGNGAGLWALCFNPATCGVQVDVEDSIVDENQFTGINSNEFPVLTLRNNTIVRNLGPGVALNNSGSLAENNLVAFNRGDGLVNNVGAASQFNMAWGNAKDFVGNRGEKDLAADPLFREIEHEDYRLYAGSPAVAAGSPQGTDLGALAFQPAGSAPQRLSLSLSSCSEGQISWSGTGASGYILYFGPPSRQVTTIRDMGTETSAVLTEISETSTGYLAVSQVDPTGQESAARVYSDSPKPCPKAPEKLEVGAFPGGQIRLKWDDTSQFEEGYQIERSSGSISASEYSVVASLPADREVFTDTLPSLGETYWYRVRASNSSGSSAYSNAGYSVPFDGVPNEDERYLLVLINETRAAPETFGLSGSPPAPPLAYNPLLSYAARSQVLAILNSGFRFGQVDLVGRTPTDRARAVGYIGEVSEILSQGMNGPSSVEGSQNSFLVNENSRQAMLCDCFNQAGMGHASVPEKASEFNPYGQYSVEFSSLPGVLPPNLPSGIVVPFIGTVTTPFTYIVNYYHNQGFAPDQALVYVDGAPFEMSLSSGSAANGTYRLSTMLPNGEHEYYFSFTFPGGQARLPETGAYRGPTVNGIFVPIVIASP